MSLPFEELPKVVAIVGSREFTRLDWVEKFVERIPSPRIIVSGGARGVDRTAKVAAKKFGHHYKGFDVENFEWDLLDGGVAQFRNEIIARYVKRHKGEVFIFSLLQEDGKLTSGSEGMKKLCEELNVKYTVYND